MYLTIVLKGRMTSGGRQLCADRSGSGDQWLEELGFEIGDYISVKCDDGYHGFCTCVSAVG